MSFASLPPSDCSPPRPQQQQQQQEDDAHLTFTCSLCPAHFPTNQQLKLHLKRHARHSAAEKVKDAVLQCESCGKVFHQLKAKARHVARRWRCTLCHQAFRCRPGLRLHKMAAHGLQFECRTCGKALSSGKALEWHELTHLKRYQCALCGKRLSTVH